MLRREKGSTSGNIHSFANNDLFSNVMKTNL